jgi:hypothetical protein
MWCDRRHGGSLSSGCFHSFDEADEVFGQSVPVIRFNVLTCSRYVGVGNYDVQRAALLLMRLGQLLVIIRRRTDSEPAHQT